MFGKGFRPTVYRKYVLPYDTKRIVNIKYKITPWYPFPRNKVPDVMQKKYNSNRPKYNHPSDIFSAQENAPMIHSQPEEMCINCKLCKNIMYPICVKYQNRYCPIIIH